MNYTELQSDLATIIGEYFESVPLLVMDIQSKPLEFVTPNEEVSQLAKDLEEQFTNYFPTSNLTNLDFYQETKFVQKIVPISSILGEIAT